MIKTDEELQHAQKAVNNLYQVLLVARKAHNSQEYKLVSEPILLELQQRQYEILNYLADFNQQPHPHGDQ